MNKFCIIFALLLQLFLSSKGYRAANVTHAKYYARGYPCGEQFIFVLFVNLINHAFSEKLLEISGVVRIN